MTPFFSSETDPTTDTVRIGCGAAYTVVDGAEWRALRQIDRSAVEALLIQAHIVGVSGYVHVHTARTPRGRGWWWWPCECGGCAR
jgi:hypothetical protein